MKFRYMTVCVVAMVLVACGVSRLSTTTDEEIECDPVIGCTGGGGGGGCDPGDPFCGGDSGGGVSCRRLCSYSFECSQVVGCGAWECRAGRCQENLFPPPVAPDPNEVPERP